MEILAMITGVAAGKLYDPVIWIAAVIAAIIGFQRAAWWWPALLAVLVTAVTVAILSNWWDRIGVRNPELLALIGFAATVLISYAAYGAGRAVRALTARA